MTATTIGRLPAVAAPRRTIWVPLAMQEARRLVLHPLTLLGVAGSLVLVSVMFRVDPSRQDAFGTIATGPTYFSGVLGFFAANLLASRDRRAGAAEVLTPVPAREHDRTIALGLAALFPALISLALVLVADQFYRAAGFYGAEPDLGVLLQGPATVLGAGLLGIAVARWLPTRGAAALVIVALVALNVWTEGDDNTRRPFGFMVSWLAWVGPYPNATTPLIPGSPTWHVGYLRALSGLAFVAALLRTAARRLPLLGAGLLLAGFGILAGIGQVGR